MILNNYFGLRVVDKNTRCAQCYSQKTEFLPYRPMTKGSINKQ